MMETFSIAVRGKSRKELLARADASASFYFDGEPFERTNFEVSREERCTYDGEVVSFVLVADATYHLKDSE